MKPTPEDKTLLRGLLSQENPYYLMGQETFNQFMEIGEVLTYERGENIITQNTVNPHVYILMDGLFRSWHWVGDRDETVSFGNPGTLFIEMRCYFTLEKAFYSYEACCSTRIFRIKKDDYDRLIETNPDFARWCLSMAHSQLYYYERKSSVIAGSAAEKYEAMMRDRPMIMQLVPLHQIASYLGITPQHLSRLRRDSLKQK